MQNQILVVLPLPEVCRRTGLSVATIYRYMKAGKFPRSVRRGWSNVGWLESDVDAFIRAGLRLAA